MPKFSVTAKSAKGESVTLTRQAASREALVAALAREGFTPVRVAEAAASWQEALAALGGRRTSALLPSREAMEFCQSLAVLLRAGMAVELALGSLAREAGPRTRPVVEALAQGVREGRSLSVAMERSGAFTDFQTRLVRAGELSGDVERSLRDVADALAQQAAIRAAIQRAVAYPLFVLGFGFLSALVMMFLILPRFVPIYRELSVQLPLMTRVLLGFATFVESNRLWLLPALLVGAVVAARSLGAWARTSAAARLRLRIPGWGKAFRLLGEASCLRSLGLLLRSGVPLPEALGVCATVADLRVYAEACAELRRAVLRGQRLSASMKAQKVFSERVVVLVALGEEGGRLADLMIEVSDTLQEQAKEKFARLLTFLEPILILLVGALVGVLVLAMLLPIFSISSSLRR